jgi:hydroxyacylglutathione hydrolase
MYKKPPMLHVKAFCFSPIQENTYILYNAVGGCIIIDPGCYFPEEKEELAEYIAANNLQPRLLLNTHGHLDHIFGNKWVAEKYGLKPHIHKKELPVLERAPSSGLMYNLPFDHYAGELVFILEGEKITLEDDELEILFTPGHSPGSVSFYNRKDGFVISGDVLFNRSIGRTDLPGGDFNTLATSIREQLYTLPDEVQVFPGHGPDTTIGFEKHHNDFVRIH